MAGSYERLYDTDRIYDVAGTFQTAYEAVGHAHLSRQDDMRSRVAPLAMLSEPLFVSHDRLKSHVVCQRVIEQCGGRHHRVARVTRKELLAVDILPYIPQHVAIVATPAGKVLAQKFVVHRVDRVYLVLRIGGRSGDYRRTGPGGINELLTLG